MSDKKEIIEFINRFNFAPIISVKENYPIATHLPFLVTQEGDEIILTSHFARNNEQWESIENSTVLLIFSEPHAYISPKNYDKKLNVPTWNYISVHCYGTVSIVSEPLDVLKILEDAIDNYEPSYREQWDGLPKEYKTGMMNGIVAFKVTVTDIQANKKLSQNKNKNERKKIIETLANSEDSTIKVIAAYMEKGEQ
jgi:transcriptional regulator